MKHNNQSIKLASLLMTVIMPGFLFAQNGIGLLRIANGANLVMTGPVNLVLNDVTFTNDGNLSAGNSQVVFTGIKTTLVGGSHFSAFNNFTPNKSSNNVKLAQNVTVSGNLNMVRGNVNLNGFDINLGSTGTIINERNLSRIIGITGGKVIVTRSFPSNIAVNPGNIGSELTVTNSTGEFLTVERSHIAQTLGTTGNLSIQRSFRIISGTNASLNYNIRFFYFDDELNGNDESILNLYSIDNSLNLIGNDGIDINANVLAKNNLGQLGHFTLAGEPTGPPMPGGESLMLTGQTTRETVDGIIAVQVFPNPAHDHFNMQITCEQERDIVLKLVDLDGKVLQQKKTHCHAGSNIITWDISRHASGVYFIIADIMGAKNIKVIKE